MSRFQLSYSTLLHLVPTLGRDRVLEAWEKSFNQFQHRSGTDKARDKNRRHQGEIVDAHLAVLEEIGYLKPPSELTARGRIARLISGFELQVTELLFHGALETLGPEALAVVFVALIHEERGRAAAPYIPHAMYGDVRRDISRVCKRVASIEADRGVPTPIKLPDWGLTPAVLSWCTGSTMEALSELTTTGPGDVCRAFRMAIQLMREVRYAVDPSWDLVDKLAAATALLNRDEVDARRQLELG